MRIQYKRHDIIHRAVFQITEGAEKQLHNIISQEVMPTEVREVMLSVERKVFSCTMNSEKKDF